MAWRISRQAIFCICIEIVTIQRKMRENLEVTNKVCIFAAEKNPLVCKILGSVAGKQLRDLIPLG